MNGGLVKTKWPIAKIFPKGSFPSIPFSFFPRSPGILYIVRQMTVNFNSKTSRMHTLIGGGPQGSQNGQNTYFCASNDNADHVAIDDQFKYCDDLQVLELVLLATSSPSTTSINMLHQMLE